MGNEKDTTAKINKFGRVFNYKKIAAWMLLLIVLFTTAAAVFYINILPSLVQNDKVINFIKKEVTKNFNVDIDIKKPVLVTHFSPDIEFSIGNIFITKDGVKLLVIENLDSAISFSRIFNKKIILKKLVFDNVFADVNKLTELSGEQPQEPIKTDWGLELSDSELLLKNTTIVYSPDKETNVKISGKDVSLVEKSENKYLHFNVLVDIARNKDRIRLKFNDDNNVYIKDGKFFLDNFAFNIDKSKILLNSVFDEKGNFKLAVNSKHFNAADAVRLINTNLLVPDGREMLSYFDNVKGSFDFNFNVTNDDIDGKINFNTLKLNIPLLGNLPVTAETGYVTIDNKEILLKEFKGYYGKNKDNKALMDGYVKDYLKSADTEIIIKGRATNELAKDYISKLAGCRIELVGDMPTKLTIKSIYNKIDINWIFPVKKGKDILLEGLSFSPVNYDRMLKADFHLEGDLFTINNINYYIAQEIKRGMEIKPIIKITGNMNAIDMSIKDIGFEITRPLPSEFLNLFTREKTFKKGTIAGHLQYIDPGNKGAAPFLDGKLEMEGVRIPSQKLSIKKGVLSTDKNSILLDADGRFRRSNYHFDGNIANKMMLPIVVKDVNLKVEDIDIERVLNSLNQQPQTEQNQTQPQQQENIQPVSNMAKANGADEDGDDSPYVFEPNLIVIEKCNFRLDKGVYKKINFGNLDANLTLDKDGNLYVQSNRFDFAQGISTLKVICDLAKHKYYIRLGAKDVDIDIVATSILDLEKEITGKASALLELNTDDKFKLNGLMRFTVKNGTITKLGLIQYVLNVAAVFRNPAAMISPSTLLDLVNVPEGTFKSIDGELNIKDNIVHRMKIKSASPQLSSFIAGRFNLETRDTSLRIYTKFSSKKKGMAGFLRNISLNSLARKIDIGDRNDVNYYSAEISQLPEIEAKEEDCQIFLTKVEGDVENNNFISSLRKIK